MTRIVENQGAGNSGSQGLNQGLRSGTFQIIFLLRFCHLFSSIKCILGFGLLFQPVENVVESGVTKHTSEDLQDSGV